MWLPSVTTILSTVREAALEEWAVRETARAAVREREVWEPIVAKQGAESAIDWLTKARFRGGSGRSATKLGSDLHAAVERWLLDETTQVDDELRPFFDNATRWIERTCDEILACEATVCVPGSRGESWAGTVDLVVRIGHERFVVDIKTRRDDPVGRSERKPWPKTALQVAAYRACELIWQEQKQQPRRFDDNGRRYYHIDADDLVAADPMPDTDGGLALLVTPRRAEAYQLDTGPRTLEAWLALVRFDAWHEAPWHAVGDKLVRADEEEGEEG